MHERGWWVVKVASLAVVWDVWQAECFYDLGVPNSDEEIEVGGHASEMSAMTGDSLCCPSGTTAGGSSAYSSPPDADEVLSRPPLTPRSGPLTDLQLLLQSSTSGGRSGLENGYGVAGCAAAESPVACQPDHLQSSFPAGAPPLSSPAKMLIPETLPSQLRQPSNLPVPETHSHDRSQLAVESTAGDPDGMHTAASSCKVTVNAKADSPSHSSQKPDEVQHAANGSRLSEIDGHLRKDSTAATSFSTPAEPTISAAAAAVAHPHVAAVESRPSDVFESIASRKPQLVGAAQPHGHAAADQAAPEAGKAELLRSLSADMYPSSSMVNGACNGTVVQQQSAEDRVHPLPNPLMAADNEQTAAAHQVHTDNKEQSA